MLNIVFAGHTALSLLSVPILVYHPAQILIGGLLVPAVRRWMLTAEQRMSGGGRKGSGQGAEAQRSMA